MFPGESVLASVTSRQEQVFLAGVCHYVRPSVAPQNVVPAQIVVGDKLFVQNFAKPRTTNCRLLHKLSSTTICAGS